MGTVIADMFRGGVRRVLYVILSSLVFSAPVPGQEGLSTLRGTVTDASGAVVPGVEVAVRQVLTNITARTVITDAQGNYEMPGLKAGTYQITAAMAGFKKSVVDDVILQSNQVRRVEILLQIGEVASQVTVSEAAVAITTEEGKIGADFNAGKRYWDLPVPGNAFSGTYAVLDHPPGCPAQTRRLGLPDLCRPVREPGPHGSGRGERGDSEQPDRQHGGGG